MNRWLAGFFMLLLATWSTAWGAQDDDDDEIVPLPPKLVAAYLTAEGQPLLERLEPLPRLFGRRGDTPHAKVPSDFRAAWRGMLVVPYDGEYEFSLAPSKVTDLQFSLGGRPVPVGQPVPLKYGNVPFELSVVQNGSEPGLGLSWRSGAFDWEPVAPRFLAHVPAAGATTIIAAQAVEDSGAALAESLGCFRCHGGPAVWLGRLGDDLDPLALLPGPRLTGVGRRVHRRWLLSFLQDPSAQRPVTRMPARFSDSPADQAALKTIVAYLSSGQTADTLAPLAAAAAQRGQQLYQQCGCAACHEPPAGTAEASGSLLRQPLLDRLAEKWTPAGLAAFLDDPLLERAHGRMPRFALTPNEVRDLAAYLLGRERAGQAPQSLEWTPSAAPTKPTTGVAPMPAAAHAAAAPHSPNQILGLSLDEASGTLQDQSGQNHHGLAAGKLAYGEPGHSGLCLGFDGQGGHLIVDGSQTFNTNADFTWSAWIKTHGSGAIFGRAPAKGDWVQGGKTLFVRGGKLCFDIGWLGVVTSHKNVNDGQWHHVAATIACAADRNKPQDTVRLYIDGLEDARRHDWNVAMFPERGFVLQVGRASANFPQAETFRGLIDEVAMWTRALDADEIVALAEGTSHLAATEAACFTPEQLQSQWMALGEAPARFAGFQAGARLKAVALAQMAYYGCLNCHDAGPQSFVPIQRSQLGPADVGLTRRPPPPPSLSKLPAERHSAGCLAERPPVGAPRFGLSAAERSALSAFVVSLPSRTAGSLTERIALDTQRLQCTACHDNEGTGGAPLVALAGGTPQAQFLKPPSLTGVASRLRSERLAEFLRDGARNYRRRPWAAGRMPGFGTSGTRLAADLLVRDHVPAEPARSGAGETAASDSQIELGRVLVSSQGLTCAGCHVINGRQPEGEVDPSSRGPDLGTAVRHLRRDYVERLWRDPARIFPGTKMPVMFPRHGPIGVAAFKDLPRALLIDSLWGYLALGDKAPPPSDGELAEALPGALRVSVQRGPTFVGDRLYGRGIACGFPQGTVLFDADRLEPAAAWFSGFLFRVPTGYFGLNWRAPPGHEFLAGPTPALVFQSAAGQPWETSPWPLECDPNAASRFDGYTVGASDVTFRYRLAWGGRQIPVREWLRVDVRDAWRGLMREISVPDLPPGARVAWTLPPAERSQFCGPSGKASDAAQDPARAPLVIGRSGRQTVATRVVASPDGVWSTSSDQTVRLVSAPGRADQPLVLRVARWTYREADREPSATEIAALLKVPFTETGEREKSGRSSTAGPARQSSTAPAGPQSTPASVETPFTYRIETLPPPATDWRPSGVAFADRTIYTCSLTEGRVHRAQLPPVPPPQQWKWQLYATGLNVPTGLQTLDGRLFVAQRPEVTELLDANGDGTVDTFRTLMSPWSLKDGFHEYAFGLALDNERRFYVGLNNGYFWSYGGPTHRGRYRSSVLRCEADGRSEEWGWGCRVPNGISRGPDGQVFFVDNQGDWIQVCKLVHCRQGVFYGHPETEAQFLPPGDVPAGLPAVWIPYEIIRSASALCFDETGGKFGPFAGQFFTGDVGYGQSVNIMRMALELVDGAYQGAAFRFIDGPPQGPQHAAFGPDGHLYLACLTDGLVRIRWGGQVPLEIHHLNLRRDNRGFLIHLTKPLAADVQVTPQTVRARRWYYPYGIAYGSPRVEEVDVLIEAVQVSADRRTLDVTLPLKTYKNCMLYYFHLGPLKSADGDMLAHPEAFYTLQRLWR